MKIKTVEATWLRVPVPEAEQVVSNLGRMTSFDSVLVRIETECGIVGYGEAKEEVGSVGDCHALALEPQTGIESLVGQARAEPRARAGLAECRKAAVAGLKPGGLAKAGSCMKREG
ncbi:MAG: hypothetical protein ACXW2A_19155 [Burkholderiales bacterium]